MVREAISGKKELVIALLRPGYESSYSGIAAVHDIACLGRIETYEQLEDGKYNIVVVGLHRVRLVSEVQHSPYRLVEVEKLDADEEEKERTPEVVERHNQLGGLFARFTELATGVKQHVLELMPQMDFESLVNMVAMTLNLPIDQKQALLEIGELSGRCDALIPILKQQLETLVMVRKFEHIKPESPHLN